MTGIPTRRTLAATMLATAAVLLLVHAGNLAAEDSPPSPNVIFILADDLGYGDLGCFGQKRIRTPHIDRLAREGIRLTSFYAGATVCAPSRCVLMTGKHLGHAFIRGNGKDNLRPQDFTVAELFKKAGYTTGLMGKWGLGHEGSTGLPTRQGFDEFFGYLDQHHAHNYYPSFLIRNGERVELENVVPDEGKWGKGVASKQVQYSHDLIAEEALEFIDRNRKRRFFLYFAATLPHANNEAGKKGMEVPGFGPYADEDWPDAQKGHAAMITRLDRDVGRIVERLDRHGIAAKTLVIFSSDNGPHAEGGARVEFFDSNGPLRGLKRDLYEGGIRVPTIARWPGKIAAGSSSDHAGYFGDLMATAAELTGARVPDGVVTDSVSFLPTLLGEDARQEKHPYLYWEFYERGSSQAVRWGKWKGIVRPLGGDDIELYNLEEDLGEQDDVAAEHPEIAAKLLGFCREAHDPSPRWQVRGATRQRSR